MEAKHTPGNWGIPHEDSPFWAQADKGEQHIPVSSETGIIADVRWQRKEHAANARLIAAAPDLLRTLEWTLEQLQNLTTVAFSKGGDREIRNRLQETISKARP